MMISAMPESNSPEIQLSMPELVKFVRQLAHDLRNHLNAAELQSAYLLEIAENNELREEIKRLRKMIAQVGANLQGLTTALSQPRLTKMPYEAKDFIEDLQQKISTDFPDTNEQVKWETDLGGAILNIDPQLLLPAFAELFANAFRHERGEGPIVASARTDKERFTFTVSEPKPIFSRSTGPYMSTTTFTLLENCGLPRESASNPERSEVVPSIAARCPPADVPKTPMRSGSKLYCAAFARRSKRTAGNSPRTTIKRRDRSRRWSRCRSPDRFFWFP